VRKETARNKKGERHREKSDKRGGNERRIGEERCSYLHRKKNKLYWHYNK